MLRLIALLAVAAGLSGCGSQEKSASAPARSVPLFGHAVGTGDTHVTELHRTSLRPVAGAPRMPSRTYAVELSPDQAKVVAASPGRLTFYIRRTGRRLGSVSLQRRVATPIWMTPRRLVATVLPGGFNPEDHRGRVVVIDPTTLKVRQTMRLRGIADSSRSGDRVIIYLRRAAAAAGSDLVARVLDADDHLGPVIELPGVGNAANFTLNGELEIAGDWVYANDGSDFCSGDPGRRGVYAIDPASNTAALTPLAFDKDCPTQFAPGSGAGRVPVLLDGEGDNASSQTATVLDASSYQKVRDLPVRPHNPQFPSVPVCTAEDGFVVFGRQVTFHDANTGVRWRVRDSADDLYTPCAVSNGLIYFSHQRKGRWEVRIRQATDGRLIRRVRGRFELFEPLAGRSLQQVPYLWPPNISDEE